MATKDDYIRYWESQGISLADLKPVVQCKDCKWHKGNECAYEYYYDEYDSVGNPIPMYDDDFCSFGERKDEVEE